MWSISRLLIWPKKQWPAIHFKEKRSITLEEHQRILEAEKNPDMAKLKSRWTEILEKVAARDKPLEAVMRDTQPKKLEENTLVIVCKSLFHLERISKPECKILIESILAEEIGKKITLVPVLPEGSNTSPQSKNSGPKNPRSVSAPKVDMKELEKEDCAVAR